jgi:hypothetical protein
MNFLLSLALSLSVHALPQKNSRLQMDIGQALRLPHNQALSSVRSLGSGAVEPLKKVAFNEKLPMGTRWKAFMVVVEIEKSKSLAFVDEALKSKTWYMRSAGLTALTKIYPLRAKAWARKLLKNDPALMVRMKAVEILQEDKDKKTVRLFWEKIFSSDSQRAGKSLWIREDLVRILSQSPQKRDLKNWAKLLHDTDPKIQRLASLMMNALHRGQGFGEKSLSQWQGQFPETQL